MKPLVSSAALSRALVVIGGMLILASLSPLADMPELINPRWLSFFATVGGLLGGKELLTGLNQVKLGELPAEWVEAVEAAKTKSE